VSFTLAVEACTAARMWTTALNLVNEMIMRGIRPDPRAVSAAMEVCARLEDWDKALVLLRGVGAVGQARSCYVRAMEAFGQAGQWEKAIWLLDR